jgi:Rad3-related DNA helicase
MTIPTKKESILSFFPLLTPRKTQAAVLSQIQEAIEKKVKFIILEAPVGSGKSAIAMTIARWLGNAHLLTPRKSLQNQYYDDFSEYISMMKGRSAYPCTYLSPDAPESTRDLMQAYRVSIHKIIASGNSPRISAGMETCATGPCKEVPKIHHECEERVHGCPYQQAIEVAGGSPTIVHNLHSFIFQTHFAGKFDSRRVLMIDEAHDVEGIIRDFTSIKHAVNKFFSTEEREEFDRFSTLEEWQEFFSKPAFVPARGKGVEPLAEHTAYLKRLEKLGEAAKNMTKFAVKITENFKLRQTRFEFIPDLIGNSAHSLIFNYGQTNILMSGTIYNKNLFCKYAGINPDEAVFIKVGSSFPLSSRPIYMKPEYMVDTSHKMWRENFDEIIEKINTVCSKFPDVKGLIHAPSYDTARELVQALRKAGNKRVITHDPETFVNTLSEFYTSEGNGILVSPVCQQGVDFKDDRARFQIILRVPYGNTSDAFWNYKVKNDFAWYNYQALIVFGQQVGRVNRSEKDFGVTILLDSRFPQFIAKNKSYLPSWLRDAIISK